MLQTYEYRMFSDIWQTIVYRKNVILFVLGIVFILLLGCSSPDFFLKEHTVRSKLAACDETGKPFATFSPEMERIYVCGSIETDEPVDIIIQWYYEDELVMQQVGRDTKGYFFNYVQPNEIDKFLEGNYKIVLFVENILANDVSFVVEE